MQQVIYGPLAARGHGRAGSIRGGSCGVAVRLTRRPAIRRLNVLR